MSIKTLATALVAVLAIGAATQSAAAAETSDTSDTVAVKVKVGDLNLASPEGAREMMNRIHAAARSICENPGGDPITRGAQFHNCMDRVIGDAVAKLNSPLVSADLRTGRPVVQTAQNSDR